MELDSGDSAGLPDELLALVLAFADPVALLLAVPAVCRQWRRVAAEVPGARLDLGWAAPRIDSPRLQWRRP